MELNATQSISTPSFALLQNTELARRATLEDDPESIEKMCKEKEEDDVFRNLFCFKHLKDDLTYGDNDDHHARYVTFDGRQYPGISMGTNLGLWYQYYCMLLAITLDPYHMKLIAMGQMTVQPPQTHCLD